MDIKEKIMKCKVICLDEMNLNPITNPKYLEQKLKKKLIGLVEEKLKLDDAIITEQFNTVVLDSVLTEKTNYNNLPVYVDKRFPEQQAKIDSLENDISKNFQ